ncbi:nicotinate phosphoribosyltransferase [Thecaphora frezii]
MAPPHQPNAGSTTPIRSLLDTDLYKLTMQQAVLRHYPHSFVAYKFTNRSRNMKFTSQCVEKINAYIQGLADLRLAADEREWLQRTCPLQPDYLDYLAEYRFRPSEQVRAEFVASQEHPEVGDLSLVIQGRWCEVILYEVPLMAIVSEAYFETVDRQWDMQGQSTQAHAKAQRLVLNGIRFSEFGTRRRRSYATHKAVLEGLIAGEADVLDSPNRPSTVGKLLGTSNVHFAHLFNLAPVGTVAHEWTMAIAALEGYDRSNLTALQKWDAVYSPPHFVASTPAHDLTIALTDTFSTKVFFDDLLTSEAGREIAKRWRGLRQDSGDSKAFASKAVDVYRQLGVDPKKKLVMFSDSLDVERCIDLAAYADEIGIAHGFGIGTNFTNDFRRVATASDDHEADVRGPTREGEVSKPLNIVIKLDKVDGKHVVKISDDLTKNTGDPDEVRYVSAAALGVRFVARFIWAKGVLL